MLVARNPLMSSVKPIDGSRRATTTRIDDQNSFLCGPNGESYPINRSENFTQAELMLGLMIRF